MGLEILAALKIAALLGAGLTSSTVMEWFNTYKKKPAKKEEVAHDEIKSLNENAKRLR
ncbi:MULTISPECIES: hypothetical protein [Priestia]|uniref:hypothetical protein n=1 Tax=Priestia TaxID=2800373 RepID=UPI0015E38066|nr:hypothetical protein [Priestia megaterium]